MVLTGKLKPDERDKNGLCPFLFAIDASMDLDIIQKLVTDGGCNIRSTDTEGDTGLHYAVNLDNEEV
jgi:ankyrin repeat protein